MGVFRGGCGEGRAVLLAQAARVLAVALEVGLFAQPGGGLGVLAAQLPLAELGLLVRARLGAASRGFLRFRE